MQRILMVLVICLSFAGLAFGSGNNDRTCKAERREAQEKASRAEAAASRDPNNKETREARKEAHEAGSRLRDCERRNQ